MIRRFGFSVFLAALALGAVSCSFPPYDEDLSLALLTARNMDPVAVVGPLKLWPGDFTGREVLFLPAKTALLAAPPLPPLQGYLAGVGSYDVRVHTVLYGTGYYLGDQLWKPVDNSNPRSFNAAFDVTKQSDALNAYVFRGLDRLFVAWDRIPAPGADTFLDLKTLISAAFGPVDTVVGAAVVPNSDPTYDEAALLWRPVTGGGSELREALCQSDAAGGLTNPLDLRGGPITGLPEGLEGGFYGHHAGSRRSYLSWYDSGAGRYRTFRWDDSLVASELGDMKHRVDRVLSNGQLFSYGDTSGYLYDAAGRRLNRFPLGALRLACELSDGTTSRLYFTLASWGRDRDKNDFLVIQVFSIPTGRLAEL